GAKVYALTRIPITLNTRATDANADTIGFEWFLWSNSQWVSQGTAASQASTFNVVGTYLVKVRASDDLDSSESQVTIVVQTPPKAGKPPAEKIAMI
ncbi:MAG: hypothetical protein ABIA93_02175, partial [Candidatus Woesearchaeota archaeon]